MYVTKASGDDGSVIATATDDDDDDEHGENDTYLCGLPSGLGCELFARGFACGTKDYDELMVKKRKVRH